MNKKHKIIMLPTEELSNIGVCIKKMSDVNIGEISYFPSLMFMSKEYWKPQHLYILSDDEIINDDWYYDSLTNSVNQCRSISDTIYTATTGSTTPLIIGKKIIATTDPKLLPKNDHDHNKYTNQIPQSLIEYYAKHQPEEVELEYTCKSVKADVCEYCIKEEDSCNNYKLKLHNNEVVWAEPEPCIQKCGRIEKRKAIPVFKDVGVGKKLYTREEVEKLCQKAWFHGQNMGRSRTVYTFGDWLKENL